MARNKSIRVSKTSQELLENIQAQGSRILLRNISCDQLILDEITFDQIKIENCDFVLLTFRRISHFDKITIKESEVTHCYYNSCRSNIISDSPPLSFNLIFRDCEIDQFNSFGSITDGGILIDSESIISGLQIIEFNSKSGGLKFENSQFKGQFDIRNCILPKGNLEILRCNEFKSKLRIDYNKFAYQHFKLTNFTDFIFITGDKINSISLEACKFEQPLDIRGFEVSRSFTMIDSVIKKDFRIDLNDKVTENYYKDLEFYINKCEINGKIHIDGFFQKIKKVHLPFSASQIGFIEVSNLVTERILLEGSNRKLDVTFNNSKFDQLEFRGVRNFSLIQFIECSALNSESWIRVVNSNLGLTEFINIDFNQFKTVLVENSVLTNITSANSIWFDDIKLQIENPKNKLDECNQRQEVYRQLKLAMFNQQNVIMGREFGSREMFAYRKRMQHQVVQPIGDKLMLLMNSTNDYGSNWIKPFRYLFFGWLTISILLMVGLQSPNFEGDAALVLMNPISRISDLGHSLNIDPKDMSVTLRIFDLLCRIYAAFFAFQIVSAFRKYIKK